MPPALTIAASAALDHLSAIMFTDDLISPLAKTFNPDILRLMIFAAINVSIVIGDFASILPDAINFSISPRLIVTYSLANGLLNPNFGKKRP